MVSEQPTRWGLVAAPSLDALAANPGQAPLETIPALLMQLAALQTALAARLATGMNGHTAAAPAEDRLLSIAEAAALLNVSRDWLYRRAARLPFTVRLGRTLRFSAQGLARYLRQRQCRSPAP